MTDKTRILLVDDHPLLRIGLKIVVAADPTLVVCGETDTAAHAVELFRTLTPDVVVMDLRLRDIEGPAAVEALRNPFPDAKIIIVSSFASDEEVFAAVVAGARAYVPPRIAPADLCAVIRAVGRGERPLSGDMAARLESRKLDAALTARERDVLALLARGRRNRQIAEVLGISAGTVKTHVASILAKLHATDRTEAATLAIQRGLIAIRRG
jgi:two-component system, NarL family, response regulator